jgi:serine/threonine protein kinase
MIQGRDQKYTLGKVLGEGTYGVTYLAKGEDGKDYAIKKFKSGKENSRDFEMGILKLVTKICDKYTACFVESINIDKKMYIVMDFIKGDDLANLIFGFKKGDIRDVKTKMPLEKREKVAIYKDLILGLHLIHTFGLVHQDIKSDNLMYNNGNVKFIDFGLACILNRAFKTKSFDIFGRFLNKPCGTLGTLITTPPEMFEYRGKTLEYGDDQVPVADRGIFPYHILVAHDIWSIGCVILSWYTVPDNSTNRLKTSYFASLNDSFIPIFEELKRNNKEVYTIVISLLNRDPLQRIENFNKLVEYYKIRHTFGVTYKYQNKFPTPKENWNDIDVTLQVRNDLKKWRCDVKKEIPEIYIDLKESNKLREWGEDCDSKPKIPIKRTFIDVNLETYD